VKPWERWTFGLLSLAVATTGFVYFAMKHFMVSDDPFAVVNHPWQSAMLSLHVLASPPLILVFGMILNGHIMRKLRVPKSANRRSGMTSLITFGAMAASGYLLQVVTNEAALQALVVLHLASGGVFSAAYIAHLLISVRLARQWSGIREVA
jgi:hypothetical protein